MTKGNDSFCLSTVNKSSTIACNLWRINGKRFLGADDSVMVVIISKTMVVSLMAIVFFPQCNDIGLTTSKDEVCSVALKPYRYGMETDTYRSVLKRCFIDIKASVDERMLRNMLLKKGEFNLNALLFKIKTHGVDLLLFEFICSQFEFGTKPIDFTIFPLYFRLSAHGLSSKTN